MGAEAGLELVVVLVLIRTHRMGLGLPDYIDRMCSDGP